MPYMPFSILGIWLRGLLSLTVLIAGPYLLYRWYEDSRVAEVVTTGGHLRPDGAREAPVRTIRRYRVEPGWNRQTGELSAGLSLLAWALAGRSIGNGLRRLTMKLGSACRGANAPRATRVTGTDHVESDEDPVDDRTGEAHRIRRPDGTELRVDCYGPADAPPVVWVHGWGSDSSEWFYQKRHLAGRFRLIVWDESGLGLSTQPLNHDFSMGKFAADLGAVLDLAGGRPAVLVGHSIGGMVILEFCGRLPGELGGRVAGLVLAHTTYTNPVRTTSNAWLYTALEKPLLVPLIRLTIALWPLAWAMNWLSYFNGSMHRSAHSTSFSGNETPGQLDFVARSIPRARPDVLGRGMLGMLAYDATGVLAGIDVPTLVIVGDQDTTTLPEAGAFIAGNVSNGSLVTLSPAKHMGLIEHHGRFDDLVTDFVAGCQPARVGG